MRAEVVHELRRVRHEPVAATTVLALEELRVALVTLVALEHVNDEGVGVWHLATRLQVLVQVDVISCDSTHLPGVLHPRELLAEPRKERLGENIGEGVKQSAIECLTAQGLNSGVCVTVKAAAP